MSRASYGADVFSPVRDDASINDECFAEKEFDYFDQWQKPYSAAAQNRKSELKKKIPPVPFLLTDETPSIDKVSDKLQSAVKIGSVVEKRKKKSEADFTRLSYITTRGKSSHKGKKELGIISEGQSTRNDVVSKTRKNNYVSIPEATVLQKTASEKTVPEKIGSEKPAPEKTVPEKTVPVKTVSDLKKIKQKKDSSDSKPEQVQANIIEKLVKDAVSFEFDGIRQMLYLQHLQLLKHMNGNVVNSELQKTIEELVEENRRLKSIIAYQNIKDNCDVGKTTIEENC